LVDPRSYTKPAIWALVTLGRGTCYWPDPPCTQRAVTMVKGVPIPSLDIAHIYAARPGGPRYRADMTDHARRDWSNVILLCKPHHRFVDETTPDDYPPAVLQKWKADRERGALAALQGVSDEDIPAAMAQAMNELLAEIRGAIEQLKAINPEAAQVLVDVDAADLLEAASHRLRHLPDTAEMLYAAASHLPPDLSDSAEILFNASKNLAALPDMSGLSRDAELLYDLLEQLDNRIRELRRLQGDY